MKKDLIDILACPTCRGDLKLEVSNGEGLEVVTGALVCEKGGVKYPIEDSIPNLLPQSSHK